MRMSVAVVAIGVGIGGPALAELQVAPPVDYQAEAQSDPQSDPQPPVERNLDQQDAYDRWPAERKREYDAWPGDVQAYFWTLSSVRRPMFWQLPDNDKLALVAMSAPDREAAWQIIERRAEQSEGDDSSGEAEPVEPVEPQ